MAVTWAVPLWRNAGSKPLAQLVILTGVVITGGGGVVLLGTHRASARFPDLLFGSSLLGIGAVVTILGIAWYLRVRHEPPDEPDSEPVDDPDPFA